MKVIVFGGSGFLGSHVADALTAAGHEVTIFDLRASEFLKSDQRMVIGDILDERQVGLALKGQEILFNFAGLSDIDEARSKPLETVKCNVLGNTILLERARQEKIKRFVYASTIYVYSDSGSFYRCSKCACELYIETYQKQYGLDYTILRYGTLYGTRADMRNSIYSFLMEAMAEGTMTYQGDGTEIREYINVLDAAQASVEILKDEFKNQQVIFTGHYPMKVMDLFIMIKEILKKDIEFKFVKPKSHDPMDHYTVTPYTFVPKLGRKYVKHYYVDMGQGLLLCMQEIFNKLVNGMQKQ